MLLELSNKGGTERPLENSTAKQNQSAIGKKFHSGIRTETTDDPDQVNFSLQMFIPPNGYHPVRSVRRGLARIDKSYNSKNSDQPPWQLKKRPRYTLDKRLDQMTDELFRDVVRKRQGLLDSESMAMQQLKQAVNIDKRGLVQLPMQDGYSDRTYSMLKTQQEEATMMQGNIGQPMVPLVNPAGGQMAAAPAQQQIIRPNIDMSGIRNALQNQLGQMSSTLNTSLTDIMKKGFNTLERTQEIMAHQVAHAQRDIQQQYSAAQLPVAIQQQAIPQQLPAPLAPTIIKKYKTVNVPGASIDQSQLAAALQTITEQSRDTLLSEMSSMNEQNRRSLQESNEILANELAQSARLNSQQFGGFIKDVMGMQGESSKALLDSINKLPSKIKFPEMNTEQMEKQIQKLSKVMQTEIGKLAGEIGAMPRSAFGSTDYSQALSSIAQEVKLLNFGQSTTNQKLSGLQNIELALKNLRDDKDKDGEGGGALLMATSLQRVESAINTFKQEFAQSVLSQEQRRMVKDQGKATSRLVKDDAKQRRFQKESEASDEFRKSVLEQLGGISRRTGDTTQLQSIISEMTNQFKVFLEEQKNNWQDDDQSMSGGGAGGAGISEQAFENFSKRMEEVLGNQQLLSRETASKLIDEISSQLRDGNKKLGSLAQDIMGSLMNKNDFEVARRDLARVSDNIANYSYDTNESLQGLINQVSKSTRAATEFKNIADTQQSINQSQNEILKRQSADLQMQMNINAKLQQEFASGNSAQYTNIAHSVSQIKDIFSDQSRMLGSLKFSGGGIDKEDLKGLLERGNPGPDPSTMQRVGLLEDLVTKLAEKNSQVPFVPPNMEEFKRAAEEQTRIQVQAARDQLASEFQTNLQRERTANDFRSTALQMQVQKMKDEETRRLQEKEARMRDKMALQSLSSQANQNVLNIDKQMNVYNQNIIMPGGNSSINPGLAQDRPELDDVEMGAIMNQEKHAFAALGGDIIEDEYGTELPKRLAIEPPKVLPNQAASAAQGVQDLAGQQAINGRAMIMDKPVEIEPTAAARVEQLEEEKIAPNYNIEQSKNKQEEEKRRDTSLTKLMEFGLAPRDKETYRKENMASVERKMKTMRDTVKNERINARRNITVRQSVVEDIQPEITNQVVPINITNSINTGIQIVEDAKKLLGEDKIAIIEPDSGNVLALKPEIDSTKDVVDNMKKFTDMYVPSGYIDNLNDETNAKTRTFVRNLAAKYHDFYHKQLMDAKREGVSYKQLAVIDAKRRFASEVLVIQDTAIANGFPMPHFFNKMYDIEVIKANSSYESAQRFINSLNNTNDGSAAAALLFGEKNGVVIQPNIKPLDFKTRLIDKFGTVPMTQKNQRLLENNDIDRKMISKRGESMERPSKLTKGIQKQRGQSKKRLQVEDDEPQIIDVKRGRQTTTRPSRREPSVNKAQQNSKLRKELQTQERLRAEGLMQI